MDIFPNLDAFFTNNVNISMYFYIEQRKQLFPIITRQSTIFNDIKNIYKTALQNLLRYTIEDFHPISSDNDIIGKLSYNDVSDFVQLLHKISVNDFTILDHNRIKPICLITKFQAQADTLFVFRKHSGYKRFSAGVLDYIFSGENTFSKLTEQKFTVDQKIDFFAYDNSIYVIHKKNFENILDYKNYYHQKMSETFAILEELDFINGLDVFKNRCIGRDQRARYFTEIHRANNLSSIKTNLLDEEILNELRECVHSIEFDNGKIIYQEQSQPNELIFLLGTKYVQDLILKRKMIAEVSRGIPIRN